jgi:hypothetical protein
VNFLPIAAFALFAPGLVAAGVVSSLLAGIFLILVSLRFLYSIYG